MEMSAELLSQFTKITNDNSKDTKKESFVYGTTVVHDGRTYVKLDGSELLTPISTTTNTQDGERVTVMIKNHAATITGNISSPSARLVDISDQSDAITTLEILIAGKVDTDAFIAEQGRVSDLVAENASITKQLSANSALIGQLQAEDVIIEDRLTAANAAIDQLETNKLDTKVAIATYATIAELEATNADIYNLEVTYGDFVELTAQELEAIRASIENIDASTITVDYLESTYATIEDLDVERGRITNLEAEVGDVNTLIFGSATGNVIQTSFANAVIAQLGNAQIKSAMIESLTANKIVGGSIITNNVNVMSEDGKLFISDETIQISDDTQVRVQIGKDAAGDYSINIWDADGNLMISEGGITDNAIKDAIIRNDMVSDTANISAHKLDIESLFDEINGSTHTIKSSKIFLDDEGQTLDVMFGELSTDVATLEETVISQETQLSMTQGQIASKIWKEDIVTAIDNIEVGGRNLFGFHKGVSAGSITSSASTVTKHEDTYGATITVKSEVDGVLFRIWDLGFDVIDPGNEPFTFSAMAYASTDNCLIRMDICDTDYHQFILSTTPQKVSFHAYPITHCTSDDAYNGFVDLEAANLPVGTVIYLEKIKMERGTKATDFTVAPEDLEYITDNLDERTNTLSTQYSTLEQRVDSITATVSSHTAELAGKAGESVVTAVEEQVANLQLTVDEFQTEVESVYATKGELDGVNDLVEINKSLIEQNADAINLRVTKTEMTDAIDDIDVGGRNLLLDTGSFMSMPETEEFVSYSKYKTYKFSPIIANDVKSFLLGLKDGEAFTFSFDVNFPRTLKNPSLTLSRLGAYMGFKFTRTDGTSVYWYGTHSGEPVKTNRHTVEAIGVNSLELMSDEEESFVGRYSCYIRPGESAATLLKDFYANPDNYTVTCDGVSVEFNGFTTGGYMSNFKMELGNKATDWTPAPEDLETRVDNAEASILINADDIESVVSRTAANETAISSLEQTSSSLASRIVTVEDDFDNLEIGGRNLALNTAESKSYTLTTATGTDCWGVCNSYWTHGIVLGVGQTYTVSFDYELDWADVTIPTEAVQIGPGIGSDNATNAPGSYLQDTFAMVADLWNYGSGQYGSGRFIYTFTNTRSTELYFAFRMLRSFGYDVTGVTMTISNFKMEIGNRATDWTPAPEDMATSDELATIQSSAELTEARVTTAESLIQQLSDSIAMMVTDGNGESLMVQTESGWTFSTAELQSTIDTTSENLNSLTHEMGDVNSTVSALQQAVDDLGVLNDYVKIGTYENEPCIELGETDSDFKLLITNTRIMFMEGSSVPAYINNQSLFIKKAVIEEELEQGEFIWKARSNGNLGLIWKGGN